MALTLKLTNPATLNQMVAKAQALASGRLSRAIMPRVAAGVVTDLAREGKSSQSSPQGRPWPRTKNGEALRWPGEATLTVRVVAGKVVATITGPGYVKYQHSGWRRMAIATPKVGGKRSYGPGRITKRWRGKARRILPKGSPPPPWKRALLDALNAGWRSFMHTASVKRAR